MRLSVTYQDAVILALGGEADRRRQRAGCARAEHLVTAYRDVASALSRAVADTEALLAGPCKPHVTGPDRRFFLDVAGTQNSLLRAHAGRPALAQALDGAAGPGDLRALTEGWEELCASVHGAAAAIQARYPMQVLIDSQDAARLPVSDKGGT